MTNTITLTKATVLEALKALEYASTGNRRPEVIGPAIAALHTALADQAEPAEPSIWVLTSEYNDYDQHGEYFVAVFVGKPALEQIQKYCEVGKEYARHILLGGGRINDEYKWYNLRQENAYNQIKDT